MLPHKQSAVRHKSQPATEEFMPPQWLPIYYLWAASGPMGPWLTSPSSVQVFALAPLGKAVFKVLGDASKPPPDGCTCAFGRRSSEPAEKSALLRSQKNSAFEPIIHPRTRRSAQWRLGYGAVYAETRGRLKRASRADRQHRRPGSLRHVSRDEDTRALAALAEGAPQLCMRGQRHRDGPSRALWDGLAATSSKSPT